MFVIKQLPEDFFVEEIPKIKRKNSGEYLYFLLEKKNWNTRDVIEILAKRLKINVRRFNVAGLKDKNAWTKQYVSVRGIKWDKLCNVKIRNVKLDFFGYGNERLKLGQMRKNRFRIVVRNLDKKYGPVSFIENYFDEQRFGGKNIIIGRALVKKEFRKVCYNLRLKWKQGDYVNPIRSLGKKMLRFYINSYQSYLWNKAITNYLKRHYKSYFEINYPFGNFVFSNKKIRDLRIPIVGFLTELKGEIGGIYQEILKEEKIKPEDFLIKEIKEISSEGNSRNLIENLHMNVTYTEDELRRDKLKAILEFELNPGSYATIVVRKMFH